MIEHSGSRATVADAALAVAVLGLRGGARVTGVVISAVRPATDVLLYPDRWPSQTVRLLAEEGLRYRQNVVAGLLRRYRALVPVVVTDALDQLDLAGMARDIVAEIDLSEIIQMSTASVVSENVHGVRVQAYQADQAVSRWIDRTLHRDSPRDT